MTEIMEQGVKQLVKRGKERGFLTYEEMNDMLPDDTVTPEKIDEILMMLDEMGIDLIDEAEVEARTMGESAKDATVRSLGEASGAIW